MERKRSFWVGVGLILLLLVFVSKLVGFGMARMMVAHKEYRVGETVRSFDRFERSDGSRSEFEYSQRRHHHSFGHRLMVLPHLIFLGVGGFFLLKLMRRRGMGHWHHRHGRVENESNVADEIRINPDAGNTQAEKIVSADEMTVDDLVRAMKRLGIKKLEL